MDPRSPRARAVAAFLLIAAIAGSFVLFWNLPGGGENSLGHVLWHVTVGASVLVAASWYFRHRRERPIARAFGEDFGASLALAGLFAWGVAQLAFESLGAYVWWTSGDDGLHDLAVITVNFAAEIAILVGLLVWGGRTLLRRARARRANAADP